MKHWDLVPGEAVTLRSPDGVKLRARFICRDTIHVRFAVHGEAWEFVLREHDDGDVWRAANPDAPRKRRVLRRWTIEGAERGAREEWPVEWQREDVTRAALERRARGAW
jgi:hypothetical protein